MFWKIPDKTNLQGQIFESNPSHEGRLEQIAGLGQGRGET